MLSLFKPISPINTNSYVGHIVDRYELEEISNTFADGDYIIRADKLLSPLLFKRENGRNEFLGILFHNTLDKGLEKNDITALREALSPSVQPCVTQRSEPRPNRYQFSLTQKELNKLIEHCRTGSPSPRAVARDTPPVSFFKKEAPSNTHNQSQIKPRAGYVNLVGPYSSLDEAINKHQNDQVLVIIYQNERYAILAIDKGVSHQLPFVNTDELIHSRSFPYSISRIGQPAAVRLDQKLLYLLSNYLPCRIEAPLFISRQINDIQQTKLRLIHHDLSQLEYERSQLEFERKTPLSFEDLFEPNDGVGYLGCK